MVIQATGLINPNQTEKSRRHFNENPVDWIMNQATGFVRNQF